MPLHKSLAFKFTLTYTLLFAASVAFVFAVVGALTSRSMEDEIRKVVEREAHSLAAEYRAAGEATAASLVERRLRRGDSAYYLMRSGDGKIAIGNVRDASSTVGPFISRVVVISADASPDTGDGSREIIGYGIILSDGTYVMAAEALDWLESVHAATRDAFLVAGALSVLLGVAGGWFMSSGVLHRISAINAAAEGIMSGRFETRIPLRSEGDEIDALTANLNLMLDRIQSLMENLEQVSSDIAHDLRTPLTRLYQRLEGAQAQQLSSGQLRAEVGEAMRESEALLDTFSALLRIAQIESGSRRAGFKPVELSEAIELVAATYRAVAEDEEHQLTSDVQHGISVVGDRELLLQMASNLVENAIRHTNRGASVHIGLERRGLDARLTICDNGPGIPEHEREKVLRRFYRLESSRTTPGSGLGMALVAAVVELHGGRLELGDSKPGLVVGVELPALAAPNSAAAVQKVSDHKNV